MVRSYMRHGPTQAFGIINSPTANSSYDGRYAYVAGWEDVLVWDVKRGEMVSMWHSPSHTSQVTFLTPSPSSESSSSSSSTSKTFAVSYMDGSIKLWSYDPNQPEIEAVELVTFNGHKKSVTYIEWDEDSSRLSSGGSEGEIVLWDKISEIGLYRLKSHKDSITGLKFIKHPKKEQNNHPGFLISISKDTYLKLWDLSTQHCIQTIVVGRGEVTSLEVKEDYNSKVEENDIVDDEDIKGRWIIITGSNDGEAKVWTLEKSLLDKGLKENDNGELPTLIQPLCILPLPSSTQPITQINFHPTSPLLLLQTNDKNIISLRIRSEEEVNAKRARRKKRDKEKSKKKGKVDPEEEELNDVVEGEVKWEERITSHCVVRANSKIKSFALAQEEVDSAKGGIQLLVALANNSIESYTIPSPSHTKKSKSAEGSSSSSTEPTKTHVVELPGHRSDIRSIAISSDDQLIASASNGTLKIWNARTTQCIRTIECGYAICCTFLPGDKHLVVGTKSGELLLFDIAASTLLASYKSHQGSVFSVDIRPDGRGLVSGSEDKDVKFWDFELKEYGEGEKVVDRLGRETVYKTKQLALTHVRTLKMTDDILCVKYSPNGRFLAISLLDSTVKIFFSDTLKFFLSLYGHKLPVLSLDISRDSKLIITSSADKNIKIWGMDFGDCHKSIFAHDDSIMAVQFEKGQGNENSHNFWSVGKDRMVKYWDGDKFELIQKLEGHHGEIWALATSNNGQFVVTGSHDKSIRIWEKTDEPLFLEEEREREIEQMYDSNLLDSLNRDSELEGGEAGEVEGVAKQTTETLMSGEKIMESLEIADKDRETIREWEEEKTKTQLDLPRPSRNPELIAAGDIDADEFVLKTIQKIPTANMEDALLVLSFRQVISLLGYLDEWALKGVQTVLISRILFFLMRTHSNQLISNKIMRTPLLTLRNHLRESLEKEREIMGYNLAALKFLKSRWEIERTAGLYEEENMNEDAVRKRLEEGRGKRKRIEVRA
ncbi:uncharacterized protein I206_106265 [Kwoniella pini CBS 10737]|uniref:Small-subunit processome Utp12 domain-containing protein n=1 Tax=Kwoniella pini CBS 10737 TaxID=1296096 RepID=A0AAJ8LAB9_9TREE